MTVQPARHTAATITDNDLETLYARIADLEQQVTIRERRFQLTATSLEEVLLRLREARAALAAEAELSARVMRLRSDMAVERFAWQERGDRVEEANDRVRAYTDRLDQLAGATISAADRRLYSGIATDLRTALDDPKVQP